MGSRQGNVHPKFVLHTFLIALYPVLALANENISEIELAGVARTGIAVLMVAGFILWGLKTLLGWQRAAVLSTLLLGFLFGFGHIYELLPFWPFATVLLVWALGFVCLGLAALRFKPATLWRVAASLNFFSVVLILFPSVSLLQYFLTVHPSSSEQQQPAVVVELPAQLEDLPNIYYIVLDGYGRQDVLQNLYGIDNSEFVNQLRQLGFYVSESSYANYNQTLLSLASSMNMNYLQELFPEVPPSARDRGLLARAIADSRVVKELQSHGYRFAAFNSGYAQTQFPDADVYYSSALEGQREVGWHMQIAGYDLSLGSFELLFLQTTVLRPFLLAGTFDVPTPSFAVLSKEVLAARRNTEFIFQHLPDIANEDGNFFVFAHILSPHPPFYVGSDGQPFNLTPVCGMCDGSHFDGSAVEYVTGYANKLRYTNERLLPLLKQLIANSSSPPVIILQSDHGPGSQLEWDSAELSNLQERFGIFLAIYFPEGERDNGIPPALTPVNLFPMVLDRLFEYSHERLPDRAFFATWDAPFRFTEVSEELDLSLRGGDRQ